MVLLLTGYVVVATVMVLLWIGQSYTGRSSLVDVAWALGVALLAVFQLLDKAETLLSRHGLVALLIVGWALRLAGMLAWRIYRLPEDGRYLAMNRKWGGSASWRMLLFYQFQGIACLLFALPFLVIARNQQPLGTLDYVGMGCWLVGIAGGTLADFQLTSFRISAGSGEVFQGGLWRYSRHPNYFFEWIHWCSYVLFGWSAINGWLLLLLPLTLLFFIFFVTGIPPTEKQALRTRGDAYRQYQKTTSVFIPLPLKRNLPESPLG